MSPIPKTKDKSDKAVAKVKRKPEFVRAPDFDKEADKKRLKEISQLLWHLVQKDDDEYTEWLQKPRKEFGGKSAACLISTDRAKEVLKFLCQQFKS